MEGELPVAWLARPPNELPHRSKALNRAILQVVTPWVAFLDDDDTWAPCFLEQMGAAAAARFSSHEIGALCCRTEAHYEDEIEGRLVELGQEPFNPNLVEITLARLVGQNLFTNNAVLWRRGILSRKLFKCLRIGNSMYVCAAGTRWRCCRRHWLIIISAPA